MDGNVTELKPASDAVVSNVIGLNGKPITAPLESDSDAARAACAEMLSTLLEEVRAGKIEAVAGAIFLPGGGLGYFAGGVLSPCVIVGGLEYAKMRFMVPDDDDD